MLLSSRAKMWDFASCYSEHAVKVSDSSSGSINKSTRDAAVQGSITCLYKTKLLSSHKELIIRLTWSKSLIGQGLSIGIHDDHHSSKTKRSDGDNSQLLLKKKKGSRSLVSNGGSVVDLYWDISSARYGSGPEPVEGFYVVVVVDGELGLLVGDLCMDQISKLGDAIPTAEFSIIGRREKVLGNSVFSTKAKFRGNGRDHDISIHCGSDGDDSELSVCMDKKKVVHAKRLRWNFRGNQTIFVDGLPVDMMWDVHDWSFNGGGEDASGGGHAVFLFRTRSGLESRLWLEEELLQKKEQGRYGFSLLIQAYRSTTHRSLSTHE